jgi:hypothetical protein
LSLDFAGITQIDHQTQTQLIESFQISVTEVTELIAAIDSSPFDSPSISGTVATHIPEVARSFQRDTSLVSHWRADDQRFWVYGLNFASSSLDRPAQTKR